jgi:N utilization substance protein A
VLVIVPDNQLSLAIGKRGQNARLAAKLTGLHVDIRSEGELEEERRLAEEELAHGREALATFSGLGPQLVDRLVEHGLFSPARIVHAGLSALEAVPGLGDKKAASVLAMAQEWLEQHPAVEAEPTAEAGADDAAGERVTTGEDGVSDAPPENMARTSAE